MKTAATAFNSGNAVAICISWSLHHSILWAFFHGAFSWLYIFYFAWNRAS